MLQVMPSLLTKAIPSNIITLWFGVVGATAIIPESFVFDNMH